MMILRLIRATSTLERVRTSDTRAVEIEIQGYLPEALQSMHELDPSSYGT